MRKHANRTYLFAPGNHERRVDKALGLGSDVVILDLEDAVAISEKEKTRQVINERLQQKRNCAVFVRVNAYDTDFCFGDIYSIVTENLDGIVLPKLESPADLKSVDWFLGNLEKERDLPIGGIELMPIIEQPKVLHLYVTLQQPHLVFVDSLLVEVITPEILEWNGVYRKRSFYQ